MKPCVAIASIAMAALCPAAARAQNAPPAAVARPDALTLDAFLARVARGNLELAAERMNVPIARAQIAAARAFPDPTLTVGANSVDVSGVGAQNAVGASVTVPIEFPGRRGARVDVAERARAVAEAELEDFLRRLRGSAANAFIDVLLARRVLDRHRQTLANLERLVAANEERLRIGDVGQLAVVQSRVEAERFRAEVLGLEGELRATTLALQSHVARGEPVGEPSGDLAVATRAFDVRTLLTAAQVNRPDLRARRLELDVARARVELAQANRGVDVALNLGWQHNFVGAQGSAFQAPAYETVGVSLTVPIPVSRIYRGELDAAYTGVAQAEARLRATALAVEVELRRALARYEAAVSQLALYTGSLLHDAEQALAATLYNYQRGGATLLEVLNAQRTVNDVNVEFANALARHARALIDVWLASGSWEGGL